METERDKWLTEYCGYLRAEAAMVDAEDGLDSCTTRACLLRGAADEIERLRKHCKEDAVLYVKAMNDLADARSEIERLKNAASDTQGDIPEVVDFAGERWVRIDIVRQREARLTRAQRLLQEAVRECAFDGWDGTKQWYSEKLNRAWFEQASEVVNG